MITLSWYWSTESWWTLCWYGDKHCVLPICVTYSMLYSTLKSVTRTEVSDLEREAGIWQIIRKFGAECLLTSHIFMEYRKFQASYGQFFLSLWICVHTYLSDSPHAVTYKGRLCSIIKPICCCFEYVSLSVMFLVFVPLPEKCHMFRLMWPH